MGARAVALWVPLRRGPVCLGCGTRCAQTVLAPTNRASGLGRSHAWRRPEVAHGMAGV